MIKKAIILMVILVSFALVIAQPYPADCDPETGDCSGCDDLLVFTSSGWAAGTNSCDSHEGISVYAFCPQWIVNIIGGSTSDACIWGQAMCPSYFANGNVPVTANDCSDAGDASTEFNFTSTFFAGPSEEGAIPELNAAMILLGLIALLTSVIVLKKRR